ncbi:hypothetical protein WKQ99_18715 [Pseudomonas atacamensis]|uniref:hypothetical protein n=1 Tax=Pseudomonas atacamensis TaxID=2565368 RepID=UPI0030D2DD6A
MSSQWKLVPVEPTQLILDAMTTERKKGNGVLQMWFEAMAAAPAPPLEVEGVDFGIDGRSVRVSQEAYSIFLAREAAAREKIEALQQRLNAADQRIDELTSPFQSRVQPWLMECFGPMIAGDREERNHRFLEEALELVQACGCSATEAHKLVDYVYGRDVGEPAQEVGGVMVTLAALCLANDMDMHAAGETELARIWTKVEQIRAKQAAKPQMSPLPGAYPQRTPQ